MARSRPQQLSPPPRAFPLGVPSLPLPPSPVNGPPALAVTRPLAWTLGPIQIPDPASPGSRLLPRLHSAAVVRQGRCSSTPGLPPLLPPCTDGQLHSSHQPCRRRSHQPASPRPRAASYQASPFSQGFQASHCGPPAGAVLPFKAHGPIPPLAAPSQGFHASYLSQLRLWALFHAPLGWYAAEVPVLVLYAATS